MKVKVWTPAVKMSASILLRSITSFAGSKLYDLVAAVADREIGENVRVLTAVQTLWADAADEIRCARGGDQARRDAVAEHRRRRRHAGWEPNGRRDTSPIASRGRYSNLSGFEKSTTVVPVTVA